MLESIFYQADPSIIYSWRTPVEIGDEDITFSPHNKNQTNAVKQYKIYE